MKRERIDLVLVGCMAVLLLANYLGLKEFTLNQQAWDAWRNMPNPLTGLLAGHPHGLRFLVYYPIFVVSDWVGVQPDVIFTGVCVFALFFLCQLTSSITASIDGFSSFFDKRTFIIIAIFAISFLMNGRLILPYLGYTLIIFAFVDWMSRREWRVEHICSIIAGLMLTSLSSGTLVAAMGLVVISTGIVIARFAGRRAHIFYLVVSCIALVIIFAAPTLIGVQKNINYFGGGEEGAVRMLSHGTGGMLVEGDTDDLPANTDGLSGNTDGVSVESADPMTQPGIEQGWIGLAATALLIVFIVWDIYKRRKHLDNRDLIIYAALAVAAVGGLVGVSILTMGIVPLLLLLRHRVASGALRVRAIFAHR